MARHSNEHFENPKEVLDELVEIAAGWTFCMVRPVIID